VELQAIGRLSERLIVASAGQCADLVARVEQARSESATDRAGDAGYEDSHPPLKAPENAEDFLRTGKIPANSRKSSCDESVAFSGIRARIGGDNAL
jgi:hypothetical protein